MLGDEPMTGDIIDNFESTGSVLIIENNYYGELDR